MHRSAAALVAVRVLRTIMPALVLVVSMAAPASATTQVSTTYAYTVTGAEVYASSTEGVFTGTASGSATGTWYADVEHTPLGSSATITGGSFGMLPSSAAPAYTVTGLFSGGTITLIQSGANCTNQVYTVAGDLEPVSAVGDTGTGSFNVRLTHHRKLVFGRCWTYSPTVGGSVTLTF